MNPTDSEISFRLRKLKTIIARLDINNDGYITTEDFEVNELSKATGEQAESCHNAFVFAAEMLGYTRGVKTSREDAVKNTSERMLAVPWEEQKTMCYTAHNHIFDAIDTNRDGHISLEEFKVYFHVLAPDTSDADKLLSFNLIDVNHDGKLSREEFLEATFEYLHGVQETELSKVFYGPLLS
ncbi:sarcoplasmic calcium-binding [Paramuricea clavata]|uniref:Sarcoplasmic calcium-binding n=1 Tax=Paramuricea clavata TaxID=317549 RepID=A0A6S7KPB9_PARCT|nr:sarcoplasmic calcium-binding [Paramuricea clavata]